MFLELAASIGTYEQSQRFVKKFHHPNEDDENQVAQHLRINPRYVNNRYENYKFQIQEFIHLIFQNCGSFIKIHRNPWRKSEL
jgi:hypothetical protein